jgi:RNA polymerase sigma-70 factor (ECF subfamily)
MDDRAFERLFRDHYGGLCAFALRYVRERSIAEDLVQDLFADLWTRRTTWAPRAGAERAYLLAAVRNRALNLRKRQAVERDWEAGEAAAEVRELHPRPARANQALESAEIENHVRTALESLPERCRLVMHLRWREQLSYAQIAEVMSISVKGVENQLSRGLKSLREKLL